MCGRRRHRLVRVGAPRTWPDASAHVMRGVVIFGVKDGLAAWARFYLEPVHEGGDGVDQFRSRQLGGSRPS